MIGSLAVSTAPPSPLVPGPLTKGAILLTDCLHSTVEGGMPWATRASLVAVGNYAGGILATRLLPSPIPAAISASQCLGRLVGGLVGGQSIGEMTRFANALVMRLRAIKPSDVTLHHIARAPDTNADPWVVAACFIAACIYRVPFDAGFVGPALDWAACANAVIAETVMNLGVSFVARLIIDCINLCQAGGLVEAERLDRRDPDCPERQRSACVKTIACDVVGAIPNIFEYALGKPAAATLTTVFNYINAVAAPAARVYLCEVPPGGSKNEGHARDQAVIAMEGFTIDMKNERTGTRMASATNQAFEDADASAETGSTAYPASSSGNENTQYSGWPSRTAPRWRARPSIDSDRFTCKIQMNADD